MATRKKKSASPELGEENQEVGLAAFPELAAVDEGAYAVAEPDSSDGDVPAMQISAQISDGAVEEGVIGPFIDLEPNLSIQNVTKLYDQLKKAYASHDAIEIDASHVNSVDTASLQLFVALKKDAMKNNKQVDFFQPSARFVESARLLDLLDILEIIHV